MKKIKRLLCQIRGLFPSFLPTGVAEFGEWAASISSTYDLPTKDQASIEFTLASIIMHLGPQADSISKYWFAKTMRAAAAKQVAHSMFQEIKNRQQKQAAEEKARQEAAINTEATVIEPEASNGSQV